MQSDRSESTLVDVLAYQAERTAARMRVHDPEPTIPKYVIINDIDAPEFAMICQWVPGIGYCYLDRSGNKPSYDAMRGREATPVETFGIVWADNPDGTVSFYLTDQPSAATYQDGEPRRWQESLRRDARTFRQLTMGAVQREFSAPL